MSDDPAFPGDKSWRNGEPDEVETEWQLMQTDYRKADGGKNGRLEAAAEKLSHGDDVVTRRYEFYKYVGPVDGESGEALAESVAPDGIHGVGTVSAHGTSYDLAGLEVVGIYLGAQMSAFDADPSVGLIDHVQDGEVNVAYPARTVAIGGSRPFRLTIDGVLPKGMGLDLVTGILSGTPSESGTFTFSIAADDGTIPSKKKTYTFNVAEAGADIPPHALVDTAVSPLEAGTTAGDGSYETGAGVTVTANAKPGYAFVKWTDNGAPASAASSYSFASGINRSLVAHFVAVPSLTLVASTPAQLTVSWPTNAVGYVLQRAATLDGNAWSNAGEAVRISGTLYQADIPVAGGGAFLRLGKP